MHRVDAKTGEFKALFPRNANGRVRSAAGALSPDDKTFYVFYRETEQGPAKGIVGIDLATGAESQTFSFAGDGLPGSTGIALSPDGLTFALLGPTTPAELKNGQARLMMVRLDGTGFRELAGPFRVNRTADLVRWLPDGQSILFAIANESGVGWRIMRAPVAGGEPVFDGLDSTKLTGSIPLPTLGPFGPFSIDVSPDGNRIIVGARVQTPSELWALDNVLAVLRKRD
jgi:hypothetical protein